MQPGCHSINALGTMNVIPSFSLKHLRHSALVGKTVAAAALSPRSVATAPSLDARDARIITRDAEGMRVPACILPFCTIFESTI